MKTEFRNWRETLEKGRDLSKHEKYYTHNDAMQRYENAPAENHDVDEVTSSNNIIQLKRTNTNNLLKTISNIQFLGKKYYWGHKPKLQYINKFLYNNDVMFYGSIF